jgi:type IV pilus assembly protein PilB
MIASASDIRSAIRVYYGESGTSNIDVPAPPRAAAVSNEPAVTVREPRPAAPPTPKPKPEKPKTLPNVTPATGEAAPMTPPAATIPDLRPQSAPPPAPSVSFRKMQTPEEPPVTTRSEPPGAPREREVELPLPRRHIARPRDDSDTAKRRPPKMVALTLLDGTTLTLPAKKPLEASSDALTARDIASALRAAAHGADASEILGDQVRWEPIVAALLSILLRKGLIADWEFVEELRKF